MMSLMALAHWDMRRALNHCISLNTKELRQRHGNAYRPLGVSPSYVLSSLVKCVQYILRILLHWFNDSANKIKLK